MEETSPRARKNKPSPYKVSLAEAGGKAATFEIHLPAYSGALVGFEAGQIVAALIKGFNDLDKSMVARPNPPAAEHDLAYYNQTFAKRNQFKWFPTHNLDISLQKFFKIPMGAREVTLQLIGEVFNLLKFQPWETPVLDYSLSTFGEVTRRIGERTAQVSLRVLF